jgi:RES domain-containing protein
VAHVLTAVIIADPASVHVVDPESLPNPNWLRPGIPGAGQQRHGNQLLSAHKFVAIPSAVSVHSWNLIFVAASAAGAYDVRLQERFALDTRPYPPGL